MIKRELIKLSGYYLKYYPPRINKKAENMTFLSKKLK